MRKFTCFLFALSFITSAVLKAQNTIIATVGNGVPVNSVNSYAGNTQSEVFISIDNNNPDNLVVAANTLDYINFNIAGTIPNQEGVYISNDGGSTWEGYNQSYNYGQYSDDFPNELPPTNVGGDPSTAIDANGYVYAASMNLLYDALTTKHFTDNYYLSISANHGATWTLQSPGNLPSGTQFDKEMITADNTSTSPYANSVYCVYTDKVNWSINFQKYSGGTSGTFSTPVTLFSTNSTGREVGLTNGGSNNNGQGANVQTGPNGEVYVCWANYPIGSHTNGICFCRSTDGGSTFTFPNNTNPPITINTNGYDNDNGAGGLSQFNGVRINCFPSMAVDKSCGPHNGRIYIAYSSLDGAGNIAAQIRYSDNQGSTWSSAITVSSSSNSTASFFPWVAVDKATGIVSVVYYIMDYSNTANPYQTDTWLAYSIDGGNNWYNTKVTNTSFTLAPIDVVSGYAGDYIGLAAYNDTAYPAWMDNTSGTWQVYVAKTAIGPYQINTNTTWSTNMYMPADVEIASGKTLTIGSGVTIQMAENRTIIVDPGAKLIVNGTLTNACGKMWAGIDVKGNASASQYTPGAQGTVQLNPGSRIEYAVNGITTAGSNNPFGWNLAATGGIIKANGATFYNCENGVQELYYQDPLHPTQNKGFFNGCTFEYDNNYRGSLTFLSQPAVSLWGVHGVTFQGNVFENNIPVTALTNTFGRGIGIASTDAGYSVNNCTVVNIVTHQCAGVPNTFTGFTVGIYAANSNPATPINIVGNQFTNNYADIDMQGVDYQTINQNTFTKNAFVGTPYCFPSCYAYNIYLDQCTGYSIQENNFVNSTSANGNTYGIIFNNNGTEDNLLYNNSFSGLYVGSQGQGINGGITLLCAHPDCYPPYVYTGLQLQCNQYNSTVVNGADISVTSGMLNVVQGTCTDATTTANNTFPYTCSPTRNNISVYAGGGLTYSYPNVANAIPTCVSGPVLLNNCNSVTSITCGYTFPNPSVSSSAMAMLTER